MKDKEKNQNLLSGCFRRENMFVLLGLLLVVVAFKYLELYVTTDGRVAIGTNVTIEHFSCIGLVLIPVLSYFNRNIAISEVIRIIALSGSIMFFMIIQQSLGHMFFFFIILVLLFAWFFMIDQIEIKDLLIVILTVLLGYCFFCFIKGYEFVMPPKEHMYIFVRGGCIALLCEVVIGLIDLIDPKPRLLGWDEIFDDMFDDVFENDGDVNEPEEERE